MGVEGTIWFTRALRGGTSWPVKAASPMQGVSCAVMLVQGLEALGGGGWGGIVHSHCRGNCAGLSPYHASVPSSLCQGPEV